MYHQTPTITQIVNQEFRVSITNAVTEEHTETRPDFLFLHFMEISLLRALCLQTPFTGDSLKYKGVTRT